MTSRSSDYNIAYCDFETRSVVDLEEAGAEVYSKHHTTEVLVFCYAFDDGPVKLWIPGDALPTALFKHLADGKLLVGHNIGGFEFLIWNNVCQSKYGWPRLKIGQTVCTMAMSLAMALPAKLEKAAHAVGIHHQKDMQGHRIMLQLSQPKKVLENGQILWWESDEKFRRLVAYCAQDVEVERELYKRLIKLSPPEREVWLLDHRINMRGIKVDLKAAKKAKSLVEYESARLDDEMRRITNGAVTSCNAAVALADWIRAQGVEIDGVSKSDVLDLLDSEIPQICREALLLRQMAAKSSTAKLEKMLSSVSSDGRLKFLFQYHGAGQTGRWGGRRVQPQNFPRPNLSQKEIEEIFEILRR